MKTIPPPCPEPESGPKYWRSLDQLADTPEFREWVEREFPAGASEFNDPVSRRHFVKIMSASFLLAGLGLTGCRRPEENIMPFSKMPENYVHGVAQFYATAMPMRGSAIPLLVKSHEGRPTKVEGNPQHPDGNGGTDQFAQASLLSLYDPDRATRFLGKTGSGLTVVKREKAIDFLGEVSKQQELTGGVGLAFLVERSSSPSRARLQKLISQKLPKARWFMHEPVDYDVHREAASLAFGKSVTSYPRYDAASVVVSLDCDFLGDELDTHVNVRRFAHGRKIAQPGDAMNRLYAVESLFSLTGANADHRLRLAPSQIPALAAALAAEVFRLTGQGGELSPVLAALAQPAKAHEKWVQTCALDLLTPQKKSADKGKALVVVGHRQPLAVHLLALAMNAALGAVGKTLVLQDAPTPIEADIAVLAKALNDGSVSTLVIAGGNPVYSAPADLNWKAAQRKAKTVIRLGYYEDETAEAVDWHYPQSHYLESWGDVRTADGTIAAVQPLIEPLFGGITELELLGRLAGLEEAYCHAVVRETFKTFGGPEENAWRQFIHDGFQTGTAAGSVAASPDWAAITQAVGVFKPLVVGGYEVVFHRSYSVDDGRFNNNGWLQETPDPITKLTWDNAILVSPATAEKLGVTPDAERRGNKVEKGLFFNQVVEVTLHGRTIRGPLWIQPGLADNTLGLSLGYGRERTGRIGRLQDGKPAGYNSYLLRTSDSLHAATSAAVRLTGQTYQLASTQEHGAMEGRPIIREANFEDFVQHPDFARNMDMDSPGHMKHIPVDAQGNPKSIYPRPPMNGLHQWGLALDLSTCVGCTACTVACQSENNIPIVGKEQVTKGREMAWIRLDRYFSGDLNDPQISYQPMFCQHCENAPCESVCPVNATVHDEEGLNVMAYNRCVGTRYCSNNCPYKVRRFNFFDYHRRQIGRLYKSPLASTTEGQWELLRWLKDRDKGSVPDDQWDLLKLAKNPDVTVRMRGIMEKCTYCVQRIEQAKISQKVKAGASGDVRVPDGTFKTACQQACPAEAIVFGDLADSNSEVSKVKRQQRNYSVLGFLDTRPRTTYLARVRNPNTDMPDFHKNPLAMQEYMDRNHANPFEVHPETHPASTEAVGAAKGGH